MRRWRTDIQYHPTIGYTYVPNLRAHLPHPERGAYRVAVNSTGFRCRHEFDRKPPKGYRRILLVGDSFTAGDCVDGDERFGDLLEAALPKTQVLNLALSGSGTDQQLLAFEQVAKDLEYDLLLVCPFVENIQRVTSQARVMRSPYDGREHTVPKPYFTLDGAALELHNVPVPLPGAVEAPAGAAAAKQSSTQRRLRTLNALVSPFVTGRSKRVLKAGVQWLTRYQPVPEYERPDDPSWLLMKAILQRLAKQAEERPVVIAPIPLRQHIDGTATSHYRKRFAELNDPPRVQVFDVLPFFRRLPLRERLLECSYLEDWHWTARGHAVMAQALQSLLAERGLLR